MNMVECSVRNIFSGFVSLDTHHSVYSSLTLSQNSLHNFFHVCRNYIFHKGCDINVNESVFLEMHLKFNLI